MGSNTQQLKVKTRNSTKKFTQQMKYLILIGLVATVYSKPQGYTGETEDLDAGTLDTIGDIFGNPGDTSGKITDGGYGSEPLTSGQLQNDEVDVLVQVVQENTYQPPDDYVEPEANEPLTDKATTEVNTQFENCADYTETLGYECVPCYQCHNGTIITDGAGLIDIRNGFGVLTPEDSKCPGFLDVCCKDPDFVPPPPPKIKYQPQCGRRNQNGLGVRIQGFVEAESQFGEWPHMCAVLHEKLVETEESDGYGGTNIVEETVNLFQCGGSLIAPGVILTAAHCVDKFRSTPTELKIRCGEWDTQGQTEPYPHQDRSVAALEVHPEFNSRNLQNDWAVLFTSEEFVLSSHIDTVCLPTLEEDFSGTTCFATGWGKDKFGSAGEYQVVLKEIDLPVVDNYQCEDRLRQTRLGEKYKLHDSFLCAGGINGKDTCKGDGGSPLVCPSKYDPNTYVQAGIVAWGIGCGEQGTPGVYASVSKSLCWIDYAMSCYYGDISGDYNSFNGYTSNVCQVWMDDKIADLERKRDGAGSYGRIFEAQIQGFQQCTVTWETPSAPLVDISSSERKPETNYGTTDTKADQTDAYVEPSNAKQTDAYVDPNAAQTDGYADTKAEQIDGSYSDDSAPVKITQETYTDDNAKLVSDNSDGYAEEKTADIVQDTKTAPY